MSLYSGKNVTQQLYSEETSKLDLYMQRQPTLRIKWKPDSLQLSPEAEPQLRDYITDFVNRQHPDMRDDESLAAIGALVDLAGHKNPRMRVLELGGDCIGYKAKQWLDILDGDTAFSRCRSWHTGELSDDVESSTEDGSEGPFDVLLIPKVSTLFAG